MLNTRLTFLYPHLFRSARFGEPAIQSIPHRCRKAPARCFGTAPRGKEQAFVRRHGKAVEPFLASGEGKEDVRVYTPLEGMAGDAGNAPQQTAPEGQTKGDFKAAGKESKGSGKKAEKKEKPKAQDIGPLSSETLAAARLPGDPVEENDSSAPKAPSPSTTASSSRQKDAPSKSGESSGSAAPLETVLHMDPPKPPGETNEDGTTNPPSLQPPPYVHHFDSYTLVKGVEEGGFTSDQAVTAMKAIRGLLAVNLELAQESLISKSDVENESYLFKAACSELKTEVQNMRKSKDEEMRRERTLLQHEVDILNQKLTQELTTLRDDLKGMFNDRKMSVRDEQRSMDTAIQQLNYKIAVALNSDSKSEVEGLRWVLTRRSATGIAFMAFMVLAFLRTYSTYQHEHDEEKKKRAKKTQRERDSEFTDEEREKDRRVRDDANATGAAEILAAS